MSELCFTLPTDNRFGHINSDQVSITYAQLVDAISPWGSVQAIMRAAGGLNHMFLVSFRQPVRLVSSHSCMPGTPLHRRGIYDGDSAMNWVVSDIYIAFDVNYRVLDDSLNLQHRSDIRSLLCSVEAEYVKQGGSVATLTQKLESHDKDDEEWLLLQWITLAGLDFIKSGVQYNSLTKRRYCSIDGVIKNYQRTSKIYAIDWEIVAQMK